MVSPCAFLVGGARTIPAFIPTCYDSEYRRFGRYHPDRAGGMFGPGIDKPVSVAHRSSGSP